MAAQKTVGNKLLEVRLRDFLMTKQQEFAEKILNMSSSQYSRYENEEVVPKLDVAMGMRDKINIALKEKCIDKRYTVDELFFLKETE